MLFSWLDIKTSYERTDVKIGDYEFNAYLGTGQDLNQLPLLRMYDQANMVRDRIQFLAAVYPMDVLTFSGSVIYGWDEFGESSYGLLFRSRNWIFA